MKHLANFLRVVIIAIGSFGYNVSHPKAQESKQQPIVIVITQHQVALSWTASVTAGVLGYNVFRGTTSGGPYTQINGSLVTGLAYTDTTVLAGITYYYVVTALASDGVTQSVVSTECGNTIPTP